MEEEGREVLTAGPPGVRSLPLGGGGVSALPADAVGEPEVGPLVIFLDEPRLHRVVADVGPFFGVVCFGADAVVVETPLPVDAEMGGGVALPVFDEVGHPRARVPGERDEGVEVVRHEEEDLGEPLGLLVIEGDGGEEIVGDFSSGELCGAPLLAGDGDEERGVLADPCWGLMALAGRFAIRAGVGEHGRGREVEGLRR